MSVPRVCSTDHCLMGWDLHKSLCWYARERGRLIVVGATEVPGGVESIGGVTRALGKSQGLGQPPNPAQAVPSLQVLEE